MYFLTLAYMLHATYAQDGHRLSSSSTASTDKRRAGASRVASQRDAILQVAVTTTRQQAVEMDDKLTITADAELERTQKNLSVFVLHQRLLEVYLLTCATHACCFCRSMPIDPRQMGTT